MPGCEKYTEMISSLIDGELRAEREAELHAHMENCPDCSRIYEAFSEISSSLSENLAEPPEELSKAVMSEIRSEKRAKRPVFARFTALAACIALLVLAGSNFGWFSGSNGADDGKIESSQFSEGYSEQETSTADSDFGIDTFSTPYIESESDSAIKGNQEDNLMRFSNVTEPEALQEQLDLLFSSAEISLYSDKTGGSDPIRISGDDKDEIAELLSCASVKDSTSFDLSHTPDYTLVFDGEQTLSIHFSDNGELLCRLGGNMTYHATATATEYREFIKRLI